MTNDNVNAAEDAPEDALVGSNWRDAIAEDLRDHPSLGTFEDVGALAREHVHLQGMIGRKGIVPPGESATEEDLDRFYAALGRPAAPADYRVDDIARPDDMPWSDELETRMLERMHAAGLTDRQARVLLEGYVEEQGAAWHSARSEQASGLQQSIDALKAEWGGAYDAKLDLANRAFATAFGERVDDVRQMRLSDGSYLGDHPEMVRAFAALGGLLGEAEFVGERAGRAGAGRDEARQQLADLEGDAAFRAALLDRSHPEHRDAVSRRSRLAAMAYTPTEEAVADMSG